MDIVLKRAYEAAQPDDGYRILVDRLWPRGVRKEQAHIDLWLKDIAPTTALRKWYGHDPDKWGMFCQRYVGELQQNPGAVQQVLDHARQGRVTLVYGARDTRHSHALALRLYLLDGDQTAAEDCTQGR
jgi:uncharacterized protein YeaO (DUF488 family)